ncbi:DNA topoisomerase I, mitochondrial-like [Lytechinus pictus]|uniref:DNA topoisomerase I, mitochondrial-like n=1 Tax=Lytechinus pictus TaxID=7653 RepID=UPI0030B9BBBF
MSSKVDKIKSDNHSSSSPAKKPLSNSHNTSSSKHKDPNAKPSSKSKEGAVKVILLSDGTKIKTMPDGSKIKVMPDGRKFKMKPPTSSSAPKQNNSSHSSRPNSGSPPPKPTSNSSRPDKPPQKPSHNDSISKSKEDGRPKEAPKPSSSSMRPKEKLASSKDINSKHKEFSSSKHNSKHSSSSKPKVEIKREKPEIKEEVASPPRIKEEIKSPEKHIKKETSPVKSVKKESLSEEDGDEDEDVPLNQRFDDSIKSERSESRRASKRPHYAEDDEDEDEEDDDVPLSERKGSAKKVKHEEPVKKSSSKKRKYEESEEEYSAGEEDEDDYKPLAKQKKQEKSKSKTKMKDTKSAKKDKKSKKGKGVKEEVKEKKGGRKKKEEEQQEVWEWWKETPHPEGVKWMFLEHKGPLFAPPYEPLPNSVKFFYDGKEMKLSEEAEEVAGFYARMIEHDYTTKDVFNKNFFKDWKKVMDAEEVAIIKDLKKCNFKQIHAYYQRKSEERKAMSKEEKQDIKKKNEEIQKEYGFCSFDGHKEKIGNFRVEPPSLFRGRGEHPKQGKLKKRIVPEDVIINCSKDSQWPVPPEGHKWKKVMHDNSVTWLASWTENIQGAIKYVMLNPSSRIKGEKDWAKYELARKLKESVDRIRNEYREDWKSKEMRVRQRAVALYFIDKLALRAGNEKEEGETADTVGCCSLRVEHIELFEELDGQEFVVKFDFLGKDSIRYENSVPVEKRVFKNLKLFMENKKGEDNLFDRLNTAILNKYLQELMEGLTAKVFRTFNASFTLQNQLHELTDADDTVTAKMLSYNRANRAVAVLCNHQRAAPKTFDKQMENLQEKITKKQQDIKEARKGLKAIKSEYKNSRNERLKLALEKKQKQVERLEDQLAKLEMKATDKEENKEIALGTSKLNYLDPRISVAWTKKWDVPVEKVYNRTQRDKFRWAIDMAGADFVF